MLEWIKIILFIVVCHCLALIDAMPKTCLSIVSEGGCHCLNHGYTNSIHVVEGRLTVECCCRGINVKKIPQDFVKDVQTITLKDAGIEKIEGREMEKYKDVRDIHIEGALKLKHISANVFDSVRNLRKLSITGCKSLENINGTLLKSHFHIRILNLRDNGLMQLPTLKMTHRHFHIVDIDVSRNRIVSIPTHTLIGVSVRMMDLSNNWLQNIEEYAFYNCKIDSLKLQHNLKLKNIDLEAFSKIYKINNLDLSNTGINELPTNGLAHLKKLELSNTPNLKRLPSIFAFVQLKEHSKDESKSEKERYKVNLDEMSRKYCSSETANLPEPKRTKRNAFGSFGKWGKIGNTTKIKIQTSEKEIDGGWLDAPVLINATKGIVREGNICRTGEVGMHQYFQDINCYPQPNALNPCEDITGNIFVRIVIWLVWVLSIVANCVVLFVLSSTRHTSKMRIHIFLMCALALADLATGIYMAILAIQDVRTRGQYYSHAVDWQTGNWCQVAGFIVVTASEVSIISLTLISFDTWYNTRFIFVGKRLQLLPVIIIMTIGISFSIFMASLPLAGVSSYASNSLCVPLQVDNIRDTAYISGLLIFNLLAILSIVAFYLHIFCMVSRSTSPTVKSEDFQLAKKMLYLITTDFICWLPTIVLGLSSVGSHPIISLSNAKYLLVICFPINSILNPFLYVFTTKIFRNSAAEFLRKHPYLKKLAFWKMRPSLPKAFDYFYVTSGNEQQKRWGMKRARRATDDANLWAAVGTASTVAGSGTRGSTARSSISSLEKGILQQQALKARDSTNQLAMTQLNPRAIESHVETRLSSGLPETNANESKAIVKRGSQSTKRKAVAKQLSIITEQSQELSHSSKSSEHDDLKDNEKRKGDQFELKSCKRNTFKTINHQEMGIGNVRGGEEDLGDNQLVYSRDSPQIGRKRYSSMDRISLESGYYSLHTQTPLLKPNRSFEFPNAAEL